MCEREGRINMPGVNIPVSFAGGSHGNTSTPLMAVQESNSATPVRSPWSDDNICSPSPRLSLMVSGNKVRLTISNSGVELQLCSKIRKLWVFFAYNDYIRSC